MTSATPASSREQRALLARMPWVYALSFTVVGGMLPYLALELRSWGLGGTTLAVALGALPAGRLLAGPMWSLAADRFQAAGTVLRLGSLLAMVGAGWLAWGTLGAHGLPAWAAVLAMAVFAVGRAPMGPVVDTLTLGALGGDRLAYGRIRRWGSGGFLVAALASGVLDDHLGLSPLALGTLLSGGLLLVLLTLPRVDRLEPVRVLPALRSLSRDPAIRWLLVAAALHFVGHVGATSFLAVHMDELGIAPSWVGFALAVGVTTEILVMSRSRWLLSRFQPRHVFLAGILISIPRWVGMIYATHPLTILALQLTHGLTFGAFWLAGVQVISHRAPAAVAHSAQGLFAAAVGGVGALVGMIGASLIVDVWPTRALFVGGTITASLAASAAVVALRYLRRPA